MTVTYDTSAAAGVFAVRRNGQAMTTPAGRPLRLPTRALAEAIAAEWRDAGSKPKLDKMPLTQFTATAIDLVGGQEQAAADELMRHAGSDLLCHRADQPAALAARQAELWQPWLDWAKKRFDAELVGSVGIIAVSQPPASLEALRRALSSLDGFRLTGVKQAAGLTGSLVLALALLEGVAAPGQVFEAAELESLFQAEQWGEDPVTAERHKGLRADIEICAVWFGLLRI